MSYLSWSAPVANSHPRIWLKYGTSLNALRAKVLVTDPPSNWLALQAYCDEALGKGFYPNNWFLGREGEYIGALALSYAVTGNTVHGERSVELALYLLEQKIPAGEGKRNQALSLALAYDWAYSAFTVEQRQSLRDKLVDYIVALKEVRDGDYLWGVCQNNVCFALICLIAIMLDSSSSTENTSWRTWFGETLDELDNGTNDKFLPAHRWFGGTDGGTFTGSPSSRLLEGYARLFPALLSGVGWNWRTNGETWYENLVYWHLWHLRNGSDGSSLHRQHEARRDHLLDRIIGAHALQVAAVNTSTLGRNAAWLADLVDSTGDEAMDGGFTLWRVLWQSDTRVPLEPDALTYQQKVFERAGKVCFQSSWTPGEGTSLSLSGPSSFTGSRQHRDGGAIELSQFGIPLLVSHGHFHPSQIYVPKVTGDSDETGHRWSYQARVISKNTVAIRDSTEILRRGIEDSTVFGVDTSDVIAPSEVGDQLWPKSGNYDHPVSLAHMLSVAGWHQETLAAWEETEQYAYAVVNLTPLYSSGKCSRYRRHVLWTKVGQIAGWSYPVILIWDDLEVSVDPEYGSGTVVYLLQSRVAPTGTAARLVFVEGEASLTHAVAGPSVTHSVVTGFRDLDNVEYPAVQFDGSSDSEIEGVAAVYRIQIHPSASSDTPDLVSVLIPHSSLETAPIVSLESDANWIGAVVGGTVIKVRRGSVFQVSVAESIGGTQTTTPAPTTLSTSATTSLSTTATTAPPSPTSPPVLAVASPPRMPQKNPTLDKMSSRLNLAGSGVYSPILSGLAATFQLTLQEGEELQRWRIYTDSGFERELTWILSSDGDEGVAERSDAKSSVEFGRDTATGSVATKNYIEWTTNYGTKRAQFWVKDPPLSAGFYVGGQVCHEAEANFEITAGQDITPGINILPGWSDEFGIQGEYVENRYANTLRSWGGAFTAEVFLDGSVVVSERDIADVTGWYWNNPTEGLHTIKIRLRAMAGSEYLVDLDGTIRITYAV